MSEDCHETNNPLPASMQRSGEARNHSENSESTERPLAKAVRHFWRVLDLENFSRQYSEAFEAVIDAVRAEEREPRRERAEAAAPEVWALRQLAELTRDHLIPIVEMDNEANDPSTDLYVVMHQIKDLLALVSSSPAQEKP